MKQQTGSLLMLPLAIGVLLTGSIPAIAAPIVQRVSQSQAQGLKGNGATVTVWSGSGTNLDFSRTGEVIQRAWLDDAHGIAVDFDAPLNGRGGASIVHLKRVTGIHFPNLPEAKSTLLTIVTRSPYGKKTYLFEVRYGSGSPQYATLAITPDVQVAGNSMTNWREVERGLERAIGQRLLTAKSPVTLRVQHFLALVRNGMPLPQAIDQAKVSQAVLSRLAEMGRFSSFETMQVPRSSK